MTAVPHQRLNSSKSQTLAKIATALSAEDEASRLAALFQFKILDTPPEKEFDDIVKLAAFVCGTAVAAIGLIDADRQWFKSIVGWDVKSLPRQIALCDRTILQADVAIAQDTLTDERFATNLLVKSAPHIRFYAGVPPIASDNKALGTLCVIDFVPRELNIKQIEALRTLGRQVLKLLELKLEALKVKTVALKQQQTQRKSKQFFTRIAAGLG